jgi:ABC-type Mn2+/Zn2+ transport system ATPase subunit
LQWCREARQRRQQGRQPIDEENIMSWTTTIEGVLADLSPENEECLMSLLKDVQFASFVERAFAKLTAGQREAVVSAATTALGVLPPRLQRPFVEFSEKIAPPSR